MENASNACLKERHISFGLCLRLSQSQHVGSHILSRYHRTFILPGASQCSCECDSWWVFRCWKIALNQNYAGDALQIIARWWEHLPILDYKFKHPWIGYFLKVELGEVVQLNGQKDLLTWHSDFFLWDYLKKWVFTTKPKHVGDLEDPIRAEIPQTMPARVLECTVWHCTKGIDICGWHIEALWAFRNSYIFGKTDPKWLAAIQKMLFLHYADYQ